VVRRARGVAIMQENLAWLWRGATGLMSQIV
jgi:hypothetical protein